MNKYKVTYYDDVYMKDYTPKIKTYTEYHYSTDAIREVFNHVHQNGAIIKIEELYETKSKSKKII